jgi:hypothetical protein
MFLRSTGIVRRVVGGLFYASAADYDVEPRTFHCVTRALRTNGSRSTNALGPRRRRRERRTRTPSTGSENALAMTSSPRLCASFRSRRCSSRYGARRCEVIFDNFIEQKVIHFASLLIPSMARPYSFSFTISWRTWSKRFPTTMRKLRVLLAQLPLSSRRPSSEYFFSKCRTSLRCFRVRGRCRPLWCRSAPGARPPRSALPNVRSSPPGVSSLLSSKDHACRSKLNLSLARFSVFGS